MNYNQETVPGGVPIKRWTQGLSVEDAAKLPIVFKRIAAMPDEHLGIDATAGPVPHQANPSIARMPSRFSAPACRRPAGCS